MTDASYIIVPGASALPFFYDFVVKPLQAKGISIEALHIPSVGLEHGNRPGPLPDMYDDAEFVANRIQELSDAGEDVIVVTHSYGGTPGTQAIEGLTKTERTKEGKKGGVIGLAYMTSLVPSVGETASSVLASVPEENLVPTLIDADGWMYYPNISRQAELSFTNLPKAEGEYWASRLANHSSASFASTLTYAGYKDVPVAYLVCEDDLTIPSYVQLNEITMIETESGRDVEVTSIPGDHVAPLSAPELVISWLLGLPEDLS